MSGKPVIWDAFIFDNEFDCLDIRLHELEGLVYRHLLIEADSTFQGNPKKYNFKDRVAATDYREFPLQAAQIKLTGGRTAWIREAAQRNAIVSALKAQGAQPTDWVLVSDADEIPARSTLEVLAEESGPLGDRLRWPQTAFMQALCFYKVNNVCLDEIWPGTQLVNFKFLQERTPQGVRDHRYAAPSVDGGWHFCNLGDAEWLRNKIQSFSHTELNVPEITDLDVLRDHIENLKVIRPPLDKAMRFTIDDDLPPEWVKANRTDLFAPTTSHGEAVAT